ncbi:uncharacterized protein [Montipora capricornis]|uniref:uncharacterized protein n=1 Tax=Montipora capricornis TaxID=246305 RepID=UPI0035F1AEA9
MFSISRMMRLCLCIVLAWTPSAQENGRNESIPNIVVQPESTCICDNGQAINPTSLARTDGKPSVTVESPTSGYSYSYNPCMSFSLGPPDRSDCIGDVSVCMWSTNGARYENIGRTSTERCGYERQFRAFRLEYKNPDYSHYWEVHVIFKCSPSVTEKAKFELLETKGTVRRFLLTHKCMCAGQCPLQQNIPIDSSPLKSAAIGAGVFLAFILVLGVYAYRRRRRPPPPANERPPPPNDRQEDGDNNNGDLPIENHAAISNSGQRPNSEHTPLLQASTGVLGSHYDNHVDDSRIHVKRKEQNTRKNKCNNLTKIC